MATSIKVYLIFYLALTLCYMFVKTGDNFKLRVANKVTLSLMFSFFGVYNIAKAGFPDSASILFAVMLIFATVGDILLLWDFVKGGAFFGTGNLLLALYNIMYMGKKGLNIGDYWFFILFFTFLWGSMAVMANTGRLPLRKMRVPFCGYLITVTLHASLSIAGLFLLHDLRSILLFSGSIMFMISDYLLAFYDFKYKDKKWITRMNTLLYFPGLMLIALTTMWV